MQGEFEKKIPLILQFIRTVKERSDNFLKKGYFLKLLTDSSNGFGKTYS